MEEPIQKPVETGTGKRRISVCTGPTCGAQFGSDIYDALVARYANDPLVTIEKRGCTGHCSLANNVVVDGIHVVSRLTPQTVITKMEQALAGDIYGAGGGVAVDPYNLEDDKFLGI